MRISDDPNQYTTANAGENIHTHGTVTPQSMNEKDDNKCCVHCRESLDDNYCCLPKCRCHTPQQLKSFIKSLLDTQREELDALVLNIFGENEAGYRLWKACLEEKIKNK